MPYPLHVSRAAYSMATSRIKLRDAAEHCGEHGACTPELWKVNSPRSHKYKLLETFRKPQVLREYGLAAVLHGMSRTPAKTLGVSVIDELRNLSFTDRKNTTFPHDLVAMAILRSRERKLPEYREMCEIHARWWASRLRPAWTDTSMWHRNPIYGLFFQELFWRLSASACVAARSTGRWRA